jgi:RNA polymerase sigma-70 factor (ECF subfamily)
MAHGEREFKSQLQMLYLPLVRSAAILCWSSDDIEDVVQETFLQALRSEHSFGQRSSLLTWTYVILTRVAGATNHKRRRKISSHDFSNVPDALPPVDRDMIADDEARVLTDAIRTLPQRQREMVALHFLENLSYAQIAQALNVSVGTVKATMFAAKASLRAALSANESEPR